MKRKIKKRVTYYLNDSDTPVTREQLATVNAHIFLIGKTGKTGFIIPINEYIRAEVERYDQGCTYLYRDQLEEFLFGN